MIIDDFPSIKKALLGDSWWEPRPKVEPAKATSLLEKANAPQDPGANTGRVMPPCGCKVCTRNCPSRSLTAITSFTALTPTR